MRWAGGSRRLARRDGRLEVTVLDAAGQPLAGARVTRRADPAGREAAAAARSRWPPSTCGRFAGSVDLPERGNWDLDIVVEQGGDRYALTRRMFLK